MRIAVLGAGAWGSALAAGAAGNNVAAHRVTLWARDAAQAALLQTQRENVRYLPGIVLPPTLTVTACDADTLTVDADLVVVATPMAGLRDMLVHLRDCPAPLVWLCKGFEAASLSSHGRLGHEIAAQVAPNLHCGVLSGPSFAQEVARGCPTALVAASVHAVVRDALVAAFHSANLRIYANDDILGVEVGGAVKNVLAIATGLCDGLGLGLNARAALITRGLAEMTRLGVALGARAETFVGLSGLGDLVLTATGDLSRNRQIGLALARGQSLPQALALLGHVAEGVHCAKAVVQRAAAAGVEMPIVQAVVALLEGSIEPLAAVAQLMGRQAAGEYARRT